MRSPLIHILLLLALGCDNVCLDHESETDGRPVDVPTGGDPPGVDPTEGPPERVCGPYWTDPLAVCGLVCVDELGVELVITCSWLGGSDWECRLYPRTGPIVSELYKDVPVWCGGPGK